MGASKGVVEAGSKVVKTILPSEDAIEERLKAIADKEIAEQFSNGSKSRSSPNNSSLSNNIQSEEAEISSEQQNIEKSQKDIEQDQKTILSNEQKMQAPTQSPPSNQNQNTSPAPSESTSIDKSTNSELNTEISEEERARQEEETNHLKEEAQRQKDEVVAKLKEKTEKIAGAHNRRSEKIRSGPHGLLSFYTGMIGIGLSGAIDSALGMIPFVGALFGFIANLIFWIIPCILLFDLVAFGKIFFFYIIDATVGVVWDFVGVLTLGLGLVLDPIVDYLPEILGGKIMPGIYPPTVIAATYEDKKIHLIQQSGARAKRETDAAGKAAQEKLADIDKKLRGEITSKKMKFSINKAHLESDAKKLVVFLLSMFIMFTGPVGIFIPGMSFFTISLAGGFTTGKIVIMIVILIFLFLAKTMGFIDQKQMTGLIIFFVLNLVFTYMLQGTAVLAKYIGNNAVLGLILFVVGTGLYVLHLLGVIGSRGVTAIAILVLLLLSSFYLYGYVNSSNLQTDMEQGQVEAQVAAKNINVMDMFKAWITGQELKGEGNYIAGEVQRTNEHIGVEIAEAYFYKSQFHADEPIRLDVSYEANAPTSIQILTLCKSGNTYAETDYPFVDVSASKNPRVRCDFESLPLGQNLVEVIALYSFQSTVDVPLKFMATSLEEPLTRQSRDSGTGLTPEKYVGGSDIAYTSPGPLIIGVSNAGRGDALEMPILVNKENPSEYPTTLRFQLHPQIAGKNPQKLERVRKASFDLPQGILLESCDFGAERVELTYREEGSRWLYDIVEGVEQWEAFTTISCDLGFDERYLEDILPELSLWSPQTLLFSVDYYYQTTLATSIEVIA